VLDELARQLRWQDVVDVAVLTFVLYRLYRWLRGTVALQVLLGIASLAAAAFAASALGLFLTAYLLQALGAVATLVVVVIFRDEIRRALGRVNPLRWWRAHRGGAAVRTEPTTAEVVAGAAFELAHARIGALFVLPGIDPIGEHLTGGAELDAVPSAELFRSLFHTASPLHDGAALIQGGRVRLAGCFLPVSASTALPEQLGSRHRAALGLSERCDAAIVVVSEERGEVNLVAGGAIAPLADAPALARRLVEHGSGELAAAPGPRRAPRRHRARDTFALATILALVIAAWWVVVGQPGTVVTRTVSIELRNVPPELEADAPRPDRVAVHLRGPRTRLDAPGTGIEAWIDLDEARPGRRRYPVRASAARGLEITEIVPPMVTVRLTPRK